MKTLKTILIILFLLNNTKITNAISIDIRAKVENNIITSLDIEQEIKYLIFLNPKLNQLESSKKDEIAKNSLINEIIKKKELEKNNDFSKKNNISDIIEKNLLARKNINDKEQFLDILNKNEIKYETVKKKLTIEGLWNQLIYRKYINNVKIDEEILKENIISQFNSKSSKFEYNLSEIVFSEVTDENLESFIIKINESIKNISFENTANIYSISNSAKNGGLLGWINELQISEKINKHLKNLNSGDISKPIKIDIGYIILKLNKKREIKQEIDLDDQLKKLVKKETNRQLNNFSTIFYKKLKKNTEINEY